jgi:hypothetical protein
MKLRNVGKVALIEALRRKLTISVRLALTVKGFACACMRLCFGISLETIQAMAAWCCSVWKQGWSMARGSAFVLGPFCGLQWAGIALSGSRVETDFDLVSSPSEQQQGIIHSDTCEPSCKLGPLIEGAQCLERVHNGILHYILGIRGIARDGADRTQCTRTRPPNQFRERGMIPAFDFATKTRSKVAVFIDMDRVIVKVFDH